MRFDDQVEMPMWSVGIHSVVIGFCLTSARLMISSLGKCFRDYWSRRKGGMSLHEYYASTSRRHALSPTATRLCFFFYEMVILLGL